MASDWCTDISTKRISLVYSENDTSKFAFMSPSKLLASDDCVKRTQVFKSGNGSGSVFLDITDRKETLEKILQLIAQQYPSRIGVLIRRDKGTIFLEINFGMRNVDLDAILSKGITFDDHSVVIPCIALAQKINAIYVRLHNLLLCNKDKLRGVLISSLNKYGNVLDAGMLVESNIDTYMGCGYAIIDTECRSTKQLTHKVHDSVNEYEFYAVWDGMPDFCHCCHAEDHVFEEYSKRETGEIYPEPVFVNKMDPKEEEAYNNYILFTLQREREHINIWVQAVNGDRLSFKLRRNTKFEKVIEAYSKAVDTPEYSLRFYYGGKRVIHHNTPAELEMKDGDTIHLAFEPRGLT